MGEFKRRLRRRFIFSMVALAFWLPALLIIFMELEAQQVLGTSVFAIEMAFKLVGLALIILALVNSKCPACNKIAGSGWSIKCCRACGEEVA